MPRTARVVAVGAPHHVTQRGNNRQQVFFSNAQRRYYLALLGAQAEQHRLRILGYCLMPNHIHAVVVPEHEDAMAQGFGRTHNAYSRHLNKLRKRSGHLWQNRYYSAPLDPGHLVRALRYVDLNPVRARLVDRAADYPWSSARAHAAGADSAGLLDLELWRKIVPLDDWADVLSEPANADQGWHNRLRAATHSGKPLGSSEFVRKLEEEWGVSLKIRSRGRPRKKPAASAAAATRLAS